MRKLSLWIITSLIVLLAACTSGPQIHTDYDKTVDLGAYKTYGFVEPLGTDKTGYSTLLTGYFKNAVQREMNGLGYTYSATNPDLLINFSTNTETRSDVVSSPSPTSMGYYGYRSGLYMGMPYQNDIDTVHYKVGTANVDIIDADKKKLVWEGTAEGRLSKDAMANPEAAINSVIASIFADYPTRPSK